jgi:tRNA(Ile)-lysidine synthase TilS/MesJ
MDFKNARRLLSCARRAVEQYEMIEDGDRIAVGISGGKDSTALLCILKELQRFYPKHFELVAVTIDTGFEGMDFSPLTALCSEMGVEHHIVKSDIARIVFDVRKESNPCSLCARMRRGLLHDTAKELGCNKLALGHHYDDVVVTFLMNLFNEGRIGCFSPVTYLSRKDLTMIRPFIFADEGDIRYFTKSNDLPVVTSTCPEDKHTDRERFKKMVDDMDRENKGLKHRVFTAMEKGHVDGFFPLKEPSLRREEEE